MTGDKIIIIGYFDITPRDLYTKTKEFIETRDQGSEGIIEQTSFHEWSWVGWVLVVSMPTTCL